MAGISRFGCGPAHVRYVVSPTLPATCDRPTHQVSRLRASCPVRSRLTCVHGFDRTPKRWAGTSTAAPVSTSNITTIHTVPMAEASIAVGPEGGLQDEGPTRAVTGADTDRNRLGAEQLGLERDGYLPEDGRGLCAPRVWRSSTPKTATRYSMLPSYRSVGDRHAADMAALVGSRRRRRGPPRELFEVGRAHTLAITSPWYRSAHCLTDAGFGRPSGLSGMPMTRVTPNSEARFTVSTSGATWDETTTSNGR